MFLLVVLLFFVVVPVLIDYYVYRNWRHFVAERTRRSARFPLAWTVPVYRTLLVLVPLFILLFFYLSRHWEAEPQLLRWAITAGWALYYVPKLPVAIVLLLKDAVRGIVSLLSWSRKYLVGLRRGGALESASDRRRHSRRDFLRQAGWTAATGPFVAVGYGLFHTIYDFDVRRVNLPIEELPRQLEGLTIVQLSDFHAGSLFNQRPAQEVVDLALSLRPDLIVTTGDYVNTDAEEFELIQPALARLGAELGVYGCLGNHDHYAHVGEVKERLRTLPIELLVNEHLTLSIDGAHLHLIGTDNTGFGQDYADLPTALAGVQAHEHGEEVYLLLAHDPSFWDSQVRPHHPQIDVMLSGHTHGGQVGFELGPYRWGLSRIVYERWAGLYEEPRRHLHARASQLLYVNRGIGTVGPPLRMGIRPEITLFRLRGAVQ